jgi:hypothetical protein
MDTGWIQVFVLTLAECVAPAGKTVCQEHEFDLQFLTQADCEYALEQLVSLKDAAETVIVNKSKSSCAASARQSPVFSSLEAVSNTHADKASWRDPVGDDVQPSATRVAHDDRLENLKTCEETTGVAPCKMGGVIVEEATQEKPVEVWRRDQ